MQAPFRYFEAFEEDETFAVDQVLAEGCEACAKGREGKVGLERWVSQLLDVYSGGSNEYDERT